MYFKRKVVLLDSHAPAPGEDSCCVDAVPLMEKKTKTEIAAPSLVRKKTSAIECGRPAIRPEELTGDRKQKKYITEDDCTNLRIDLELCADSKHFIDRL
jgi:hypothetical protein